MMRRNFLATLCGLAASLFAPVAAWFQKKEPTPWLPTADGVLELMTIANERAAFRYRFRSHVYIERRPHYERLVAVLEWHHPQYGLMCCSWDVDVDEEWLLGSSEDIARKFSERISYAVADLEELAELNRQWAEEASKLMWEVMAEVAAPHGFEIVVHPISKGLILGEFGSQKPHYFQNFGIGIRDDRQEQPQEIYRRAHEACEKLAKMVRNA